MPHRSRKVRPVLLLLVFVLFGTFLSGCGKAPDLSVFVMPRQYIPDGLSDKVEQKLQAAFGAEKEIVVIAAPMYNDQKLLVELAAGGNGILVLPKETLENLAPQGPAVQLDKWFKASDYPGGVMDSVVGDSGNEKKVKGLFAIPIENFPVFKDYKEKDIVAFIPANAPNPDLSVQALKELLKP